MNVEELLEEHGDCLLKDGSKNELVRALQEKLNELGYQAGSADGWFGESTEKAVKAYQRDKDLVVDGLVGPATQRTIFDQEPPEWALKESDIEKAAEELGVDIACVHAVAEVESAGAGFFKPGVPAILFERHWMRRRMVHHGIDVSEYDVEAYENIVNENTGGYKGGIKEHDRLAQAKDIHMLSALESASWGRFQIMGFHAENLGYGTAVEFVQQMEKTEGEHLMAFVAFIKADPDLHEALKNLNWTQFAKGYNGPAFRKHQYHVRMAAAYDEHKKA